jgi:hypothetical protein
MADGNKDRPMPFSADSVDPAQNLPLMVALGRLVVRASELDKEVGEVLVRLCDPWTKECLRQKSVHWKLTALKSIVDQIKDSDPVLAELSEFCVCCVSQLRERNSPVHSTYIIDEDGIVKWDPKREPKFVQPDDIEKTASELHRLAQKAVLFNRQVRDLRRFAGIIEGKYVPAQRSR